MKNIILLSVVLLVAGIGAAFVALRPAEVFGEPFRVASATPLQAITANPGNYLVADVRTEGRIVRQCPSSGCWFFLDDGAGRQVRVELGHLGRTFPQHIGGIAVVEGRLTQSGKDLEIIGNGVQFRN